MASSKTKIFNLALSHLLLSRQVSETETDTVSNEVRVLNTFWPNALAITLQELDLDSLSEPITLELLEELNEGPWSFVYKYPIRCAYLRRIDSGFRIDNESTQIAKRIGIRNGQKVIFTNQEKAVAECVPGDINLEYLPPSAEMALSYQLAHLSSSLITGKGAARLKQELYANYVLHRENAKSIDSLENKTFYEPYEISSFVNTRMS